MTRRGNQGLSKPDEPVRGARPARAAERARNVLPFHLHQPCSITALERFLAPAGLLRHVPLILTHEWDSVRLFPCYCLPYCLLLLPRFITLSLSSFRAALATDRCLEYRSPSLFDSNLSTFNTTMACDPCFIKLEGMNANTRRRWAMFKSIFTRSAPVMLRLHTQELDQTIQDFQE